MTILIVDDEPGVLRYLAMILRSAGYEVLVADGGDEALAACKSRGCCFDLMISDVGMPHMNARELADCMNLSHPDASIIFMSGYHKSRQLLAGLTARGFRNGYTYIEKPFTAGAILAMVRTAFATNFAIAGGV